MMKIENNFRDKIYNIIINLLTKQELKRATKNLGRLEIKEDEIICYVNPKRIKRLQKSAYTVLALSHETYDQDLQKKCNLEKPIHYVFDMIPFNTRVHMIFDGNGKTIFKNCTFQKPFEISDDTITFKNNSYDTKDVFYLDDQENLISVKYANFVTMQNERIRTELRRNNHPRPIKIKIEAKRIEIENTQVQSINHDYGKIQLKGNEIHLNDSRIKIPEIEIEADTLERENTPLIATKEMKISSKNKPDMTNLTSKQILYNGNRLINNPEEMITTVEDKEQIGEVQQDLITILSQIRDKYNQPIYELESERQNHGLKQKVKKL